ncbi:MAG: SDR family oxidoreductase [Candidatus Thermoplasmatota archaeon]|jgi:NAD(P)-dependent dehydrogenase (short-subunit alcohol dehydrogenase family)|nr:SDR family oxidoreductase [Candidatus Thermoplasmatota archaeon]
MYDSLRDKVVVVTGASNGIGEAIAKRFSAEGGTVYNLDIIEKKTGQDSLRYIRCDVSRESEVRRTISSIVKQEGNIDILVNNAGIENFGSAHETEVKEWERIIGVNLTGSFLVSKYAIPHMIKKGGVIEFMSSIQSQMIQRRLAAYVASKHGIIGLMKSIALDYAPKIRSVAICPGSVRTPLLEWTAIKEVGEDPDKVRLKIGEWGKLYPMKRIAEPEEIANLVAFLASDQAGYITGISILIDGGLSVFLQESVPENEVETP